ncbi:MAG: GtrA family protein [Gammaproteobacteria bacterium]|jgi:putative flippase GtrA|nr:GtrA family protein [Gammaproteobacteria bacterium]MBT4493628.1 GtrA family protein [Gammaproteobacteria bacterium]MBT7370100.1 GtrA family protein [Gammaproteobacteria bacterium]
MSLKISILKIYHDHAEVIRYLIAGGYNTVFGFLAFAGLYLLLEPQLHYLVIAAIAQILAITNAFLVYRYFVFKSEGNLIHEYLKIYVVYGVTFVLSIVMLALLVELLGMHPIVAQFFIIVVTVIVSYFGNSRFTFNSKSND